MNLLVGIVGVGDRTLPKSCRLNSPGTPSNRTSGPAAPWDAQTGLVRRRPTCRPRSPDPHATENLHGWQQRLCLQAPLHLRSSCIDLAGPAHALCWGVAAASGLAMGGSRRMRCTERLPMPTVSAISSRCVQPAAASKCVPDPTRRSSFLFLVPLHHCPRPSRENTTGNPGLKSGRQFLEEGGLDIF